MAALLVALAVPYVDHHLRVRAHCLHDLRDALLQGFARVADVRALVGEVDLVNFPDGDHGGVGGCCFRSIARVRHRGAEHRTRQRGECEPSSTARAEHDEARQFLVATMLARRDRRNQPTFSTA
jgi:hypothetical protein